MCGICGFTHLQSSPKPGRIQELVGSLRHRGPDQQGVFESGVVSLGAARLKIIDLEAGDQPIVSEDGDSVIAFNGEIYNFAELRLELERKGHRFRTHTDTETVLEAFREWDVACFSKFRGMFAVALWTESSGRLVLARDRMGIKPLYTALRNGDLYFGSELKTIFGHPEIERRLSLEALDCYLALNYVPGPWTMVEGIEKLQPGYWLEWRQGRVRSEAYWKLPFVEASNRSLDSACEELDALMRQSVKEHLVSDVPLGVWLSGGVDSSTVLHYAASAAGRRLKTFSISFQGRSFDETAYIRQAAEQYGTDHEEYDVSPESDLAGAIEQLPYYFDEPCADGGALPAWFLSALTKKSATVALSGEGADEVFGGYLTYRADHLARRVRMLPDVALKLALSVARRWPVSDEKISLEYMLKRFLTGCRMSPERAHVYWTGTFSDQEKRDLVRAGLPRALDHILAELREKGDRLPAYLWFDQKVFLPDDILIKVDRVSMAHSVEVRPPFLDHRIVEFAAALPDRLKVRGSYQKVVLKELMKRKLPDSILKRKKMGFDFPAHDWLRGPLRPLLLDTMAWGRANHPELFRAGAVDNLVDRHLDRRANVGYHLWGLMNLFLWMKRWRIQTTAECDQRMSAAVTALTST
jgi:asparagine synthase (glutamine-hydrolysing)